MTPIDPRHLTHLLAIEEHGSFSRAATILGVSQPALSNSIAILERRVGATVLTRSGRGATVNEMGQVLLRRARELRTLLKGAQDEVINRKAGLSGPLHIGATPSMGEKLLPEVLAVLRQRLPNLTLTVTEGRDDSLLPALLDGRLDLALGEVGQNELHTGIEEEMLMEDPHCLGVGPNCSLAARSTVSLAETVGQTWVMPLPGGSAYAHAHALFLTAGVPWPHRNIIATNSIDLSKRLIATSQAIGLVTGLLIAGWDVPMQRVWVDGVKPRKIGIKRRKDIELSEAAALLSDILRETTRGWIAQGVGT